MIHLRETLHPTRIIDRAEATIFGATLQGRVILPGDNDYDEARALWNGMIDKYPAMIVLCQNVQDVVATVNFAHKNEIPTSIRGGGHNVSGSAVRENGIVIDFSEMKQVKVDPVNQVVRAQGGATLDDLDNAAQQYGLAVPVGVASETGIAGLTLGGGFGWLRRKYGLTCDNLIGAEVVTSDGKILYVSEDEHADLLWALRGGGGQFGVVTEFVYRAYPVGPNLMFCFVLHPGEQAKEALEFYRDYITDIPDEISSMAVLGHVPPEEHFPTEWHTKPFVLFGACYVGDIETGKKLLQPLRDYDTPIVDFSGVMPYVEMQTVWDEDYPAGELRYYWRSAYINNLSDEAIDTLVDYNDRSPSVLSTIDVWHLGGAINQFGADTSAFGERDSEFLIGIEANWESPEDDIANVDWGRTTAKGMQAFSSTRQYLNFPGFLEGDAWMEAMFGENANRIKEIKAKYDPINFFSLKG